MGDPTAPAVATRPVRSHRVSIRLTPYMMRMLRALREDVPLGQDSRSITAVIVKALRDAYDERFPAGTPGEGKEE